jgi:hypothetical protein
MNDRAHMPCFDFSASLICWRADIGYGMADIYSSQKTVQTEQKAPERKVLFWYDPMKPDTKFDKPGKSPFMDMDLVPKYADESGKSSGGIRIDPTQVQNLGLKTQKVTRGMLNYSQTIPANVSYNEYQFVIVQARLTVSSKKCTPDDWRSCEERHSAYRYHHS